MVCGRVRRPNFAARLTKVTPARRPLARRDRPRASCGIRRNWRYVPALKPDLPPRVSRTARALRLGRLRRGKAPRTQNNRGTAAQRTDCERCKHPKGDVMQLVNFVKSFARNEEGQDLLEYALLVALIALVAIAAVTAAGTSVSAIFTSIAGKLGGAAS
jgi:pilus assembly protein Flp/PilA